MKLFLEISKTGDFKRLIIKGVATEEQCSDKWVDIVRDNEKASNRFQFSTYLELSQSYLQLIREHQLAKACLIKLTIVEDKEAIETLRDLGFNINTKDKESYYSSIMDSMNNSNNLITQILLKRKDLDNVTEETKNDQVSFEDMIADTGFHLKFPLTHDVTLAQFNSYRKVIKSKYKNNGRTNKETGLTD